MVASQQQSSPPPFFSTYTAQSAQPNEKPYSPLLSPPCLLGSVPSGALLPNPSRIHATAPLTLQRQRLQSDPAGRPRPHSPLRQSRRPSPIVPATSQRHVCRPHRRIATLPVDGAHWRRWFCSWNEGQGQNQDQEDFEEDNEEAKDMESDLDIMDDADDCRCSASC